MTPEERAKDDEIAKGFLEMLDEARKLLSVEGEYVGLCPHCLGSQREYVVRDGYTGVQGIEDNKIIMTLKCSHGLAEQDDTIPF